MDLETPSATTVTTDESTTLQTGGQIEQYVVFRLEDEEYAAPILDVQEIIPAGEITPFPNAEDFISGIINVRGTVATVLNLAKRFHLQRENQDLADKYIVLTQTDKALFGIQVDMVSSVMKIAAGDIRSASSATDSKIQADFVKGVAVIEGRVILILDLHKILHDARTVDATEEAPSQTNQQTQTTN